MNKRKGFKKKNNKKSFVGFADEASVFFPNLFRYHNQI